MYVAIITWKLCAFRSKLKAALLYLHKTTLHLRDLYRICGKQFSISAVQSWIGCVLLRFSACFVRENLKVFRQHHNFTHINGDPTPSMPISLSLSLRRSRDGHKSCHIPVIFRRCGWHWQASTRKTHSDRFQSHHSRITKCLIWPLYGCWAC